MEEKIDDKKIVQITEEEYLELLKKQENKKNVEYILGNDLISQGPSTNKSNKFISAFDKFAQRERMFTYPVKEEKIEIKNSLEEEKAEIRPLISNGNPNKSSIFEPYRIPKTTHSFIPKEQLPKIEPIKTKEEKIIEKSVNKTKIKKKRKLTKLGKSAVIILIVINLGIISSLASFLTNKFKIHSETEQVKVVLQEDFNNTLNTHNIELINIDKEIELFSKEYIKKNLFNFYLKTNNNKDIMDKLIKKMTDNEFNSFSSYIINEGYFYKIGDDKFLPNYKSWENHMEAHALNIAKNKGARQ